MTISPDPAFSMGMKSSAIQLSGKFHPGCQDSENHRSWLNLGLPCYLFSMPWHLGPLHSGFCSSIFFAYSRRCIPLSNLKLLRRC